MADKITPKGLSLLSQRADKVADEAGEATVKALRTFFNNYIKNVKAGLNSSSLSDSQIIDLAEQNAMIKDLREILPESGYEDLVARFDDGLASVGDEALQYFNDVMDAEKTFSGISREAIDLLANNLRDELDFMVDQKLIRPLETAIRNSALSLSTRAEVVEDITRTIDSGGILRKDGKQFTNANIEVMAQDANRQFAQAVRSEKAKELGLEIFLYSGPLDKFTSDQCRTILTHSLNGGGPFYYRDQITNSLHPKLRGNPLITRGHPNCRHEWLPVSERYAKSQGMRVR